MLNFSRLGAVRALFFKSEQYSLIDMPVQVGASVDKHGHVKAAHTRIQKVRVERAAPVQANLFGGDEPAQKDKRPARLDAFIRKHGGLAQLAHLMGGMTEGQQQRIFEEMGKLGGKTAVEVSAMFDHVKPEAAPQADMFAPPATAKESPAVEPAAYANNRKPTAEQAAKMRELRETLRDMMATRKSRNEVIPQGWLDKLAEADAVLGVEAVPEKVKPAPVDMTGWTGPQIVAHELLTEWLTRRAEFLTDKVALGQFKRKLRREARQIPADDQKAVFRIDSITNQIWPDYDPKIADIEFKAPEGAPAAVAPPTLHRYALQYRPPGIGAVPKGFVSHTEDPSVPAARHGVIAYDHELTAEEVKQYELVPLGADGAELQLPKLPYAVRKKVEEAMSSLHYIADAVKSGDANLADYKDDIDEAKAALHIFATYAGQKGIDKDKVLAELGGVPEFAPKPAAEVLPKEGDTKTENGVEYVMRDSRWHRAGEDAAPAVPAENGEPKLGAKAKRALEVLEAGGFFRKQLETQYRGGDKFETRLHEKDGSIVSGIGIKTFFELEAAHKLSPVGGIPRSTVWRSEWKLRFKLRDHAKPDEAPKIEPVIAETMQNPVENAPEVKNEYVPGSSNPFEVRPVHNPAEPFGVAAGITKKARIELNAQAVAIVNRGAPFSDEDKAVLRQYSGNGGCGDSLNEFYTLPEVAGAMWSVAQRLGVKGDVLEPSCGPGVFLHTAPGDSKVTGVEWDDTSARIAKALHGDRHEVQNASLERFATQDDRQFDGVLGNVPFGLRGGLIKDDKPKLKTADAYFCDTSMDKCKAGGIVGLIVPTGIMDSKTNRTLREAMLRKGQFLGAQRMPNTAFEHSHTEVTTDVIWFRKFPDDVAGALSSSAIKQEHLKALGIWDDEYLAGNYFTGRGAANVLGTMGAGWRAKAGMGADITVEGSMQGVPEALREFQPEESKTVPGVTDILAAVGLDEKARAVVLGGALTRPYADKSKVGDTKDVDGVAYVLQGKPPRWHRIDEVLQSEALTQGQDIAARIERAMAYGGSPEAYAKLADDLRAWVEAHGIPSKNKDILLGVAQDKTLYRLIGAVKSNGELSDVVLGKVAAHVRGDFEATVQGMLTNHETVAVNALAKAAGIHDEEALDQLYGSPKYAIDPSTGEWTTRDIYLSGDLWAKVDAIKNEATRVNLAQEEVAPELRKKLEQQAALLMETIAPVSLEDAFINTNSAFLPPSILSAFLTWRNNEGPGANKWTKELEPVNITFSDGVYVITGGNNYGLMKDLDKYLNRTGLRKEDKHTIDDLNVEFKDWLCASQKYREIAEDLYNRKFKGFAEREFSNEPMDIPGMNTEGLKDYQWGGLRWALNAGKGIIAADVGLGKTARALMLARTLKTTGQAKRPMIVVPKSVLSNWAAECEKWFPGSKVLLIGEKGDNPAERKRKYHDMQQNDYDFIICSEPSFEEIDLDPTTKGEYNSKDFWVQRGDAMDRASDKRTAKIKAAWDQARASQEFGDNTRTDATYFNDLGVDALIHDEFHHQKNLCAIKSRFGESPKFLGGGGQSMRSLDFNLKARWLLDQQNGKNVYGLTATPTKNSPIEIYAMLSHVAPEAFERIGVRNSEEFLDRFARFEDGMALTTGGLMEDALITKGFQNMDELRDIMRRYIHRQTAEEVGLQLPKRQDVTHMIDMDAAQESAYSELRALAAESGGKDSTGDSHIFSIMDKMNKAAVDLSLVDDAYDGTKSPKYIACAQEAIKGMKDGGQIIFSDYVESHEKIVAALVKSGIPRNQVGIINAQAAKTSEARQKICDQFNEGKLKVVIGNTATMGEGLNLQKGTSDIHHLDLPWEPASMQQRNGRGLRQGNTNKGVRIHSYLAKGSFDGYRLQSILAKKDWQDMIWNGGSEVENLNQQGSISRDEMMIMLSSDPDQAREAFESNHKAKEERLIAGKTADAAQRFVKFQEVKRSYSTIQNKETQSAARLKAKMDKEYSGLKHDKYFTAKQALDMETPVIVTAGGALLHAGAGLDIGEGDKSERFVVTSVDQRGQRVTMRRYGDGSTQSYTRDVKDLAAPKTFAYDQQVETDLVAKELAARPMVIKNLSDVMKLPTVAVEANHAALQKQIWEGVTAYSIRLSGKVAMVEKATGKPVITDYYNVGVGKKDFNQENYDFMLPTEANKAKVIQAWKDARRASSFSVDYVDQGKRRQSKTVAKRNYGSSLEHDNPWSLAMREMHGEDAVRGSLNSPTLKAARAALEREQLDRVRHAPTLQQAFDEAAAVGTIGDADSGYGAHVKLPKKVIATLWAKARKEGSLYAKTGTRLPKNENYGRTSNKHAGYFTGGNSDDKSVHSALLGMAAKAGHDDLVHAMVESELRHGNGIPDMAKEALQAISQGYSHSENRIIAMQKLADKAGILDMTRGQIGAEYGTIGANHQWDPDRTQTVRDKLAELLASSRAKAEKKVA